MGQLLFFWCNSNNELTVLNGSLKSSTANLSSGFMGMGKSHKATKSHQHHKLDESQSCPRANTFYVNLTNQLNNKFHWAWANQTVGLVVKLNVRIYVE